MKNKVKIEAYIDDVIYGWWDPDGEEFVEIETDEDIPELTNRADAMELLVHSVLFLCNEIKSHMKNDLCDIWERIDRLEEKINKKE